MELYESFTQEEGALVLCQFRVHDFHVCDYGDWTGNVFVGLASYDSSVLIS